MKDISSMEEIMEITDYMQKEVNDIPRGSHYSEDIKSLMTKVANKLELNTDEKLAFGIGCTLGCMFDTTPEWLRKCVEEGKKN